MMIAGIKGKDAPEARHHEDSLTAAVFGHLRYLPPDVFWPALFAKAHDSTADERPLTDALKESGVSPERCARLEIEFWQYHGDIGEPDMILKFFDRNDRRDDRLLLTIIVEVKFHAEQSGDQLARYMELVTGPRDKTDYACLIYLTPRESLKEINDTIGSHPHLEALRDRMFRLQWQDVLDIAADAAMSHGNERFPCDMILRDVAEFLKKRGLERFKGMRDDLALSLVKPKSAPWARRESEDGDAGNNRRFNGMNESSGLELFAVEKGGWVQ